MLNPAEDRGDEPYCLWQSVTACASSCYLNRNTARRVLPEIGVALAVGPGLYTGVASDDGPGRRHDGRRLRRRLLGPDRRPVSTASEPGMLTCERWLELKAVLRAEMSARLVVRLLWLVRSE